VETVCSYFTLHVETVPSYFTLQVETKINLFPPCKNKYDQTVSLQVKVRLNCVHLQGCCNISHVCICKAGLKSQYKGIMPSNRQTKLTIGPSRVERRQMPKLLLPADTSNIQCGPSPHSTNSTPLQPAPWMMPPELWPSLSQNEPTVPSSSPMMEEVKEPTQRERETRSTRCAQTTAVPPLCFAVPMLWERTQIWRHAQRRARATCEDKLTFLYILTLLISSFQLSYQNIVQTKLASLFLCRTSCYKCKVRANCFHLQGEVRTNCVHLQCKVRARSTSRNFVFAFLLATI
jgi:hypothetical protein